MNFVKISVMLMVVALVAVGCQSDKKEMDTLKQRNTDLEQQLAERDAKLRQMVDPSQIQSMQAEIAQRDAKIKELAAQLRQPSNGSPASSDLAGIETSYDAKTGAMTVNLPASILFDSGKTDLKSSANATLNKVVAALKKDYPGKKIRVEGHTDTDPIVKSKDKWDDNLDLSMARAEAVTRYLLKQGVKPTLITTSGMGEWHPKASKAASRRVEIVVQVR